MDKLLFSTREVFTEYLLNNEMSYFNVPEYQRGYKWNAEDVKTLLNDLKTFEKSNPLQEHFYCLQNITIVPDKERSCFNVVDGQQRLTTIYILLSYLRKFHQLNNFIFTPECLRYSVREETAKVLMDKISTGTIWETTIEPQNARHKDEWYILDVANGIQEWFKDNDISNDIITDKLQIIINKMDAGNEESIFAGLNGGKVDLDGADLVRAELITRSAREKYDSIDPQKVGEFRAHIGLQLDEINRWWADPYHKTFFKQLLPDGEYNDRFKDNYPINTLYKLYYIAYRKDGEVFDFHFFEHGRDFNQRKGDDHWELYETLIYMHTILKEWYDNPYIYHWVGYLFYNFKGDEVSFANIWNHWLDSEQDKKGFIKYLKKLIQDKIIAPEDGVTRQEARQQLVESVRDLQHCWYHHPLLGKVLILSEIIWIEQNQFKHTLIPNYFRAHNEQQEHIRSCHPNPKEAEKTTSVQQWRDFIESTYNLEEDAELKANLVNLLDRVMGDYLSEEQINQINQEMNKHAQNSIGNLVLLNASVNMSYGNAQFRDKVLRLIQEFMATKYYIRPYTLNVFLKKIQDDDTEWRWTKANIEKNANSIADRLKMFFNAE